MSESKFLTIQLSAEDCDRLQTEATKLNVSPETLAQTLLHNSLAQVNPFIHPGEAVLQKRKKYTLDELLEGMTLDNFHPEFETGNAVGNEDW